MSEKWKEDWQPMIDAIGTDFKEGIRTYGADEIEKGAIRRFLEPLEFDCLLHYDRDVAIQYGYKDIVAPYSSLRTWTIPPQWEPGKPLFIEKGRNAQPEFNPLSSTETDLAPKTSGYFFTDLEFDYFKPVTVGDRLCSVGYVLLSCVPKETKVGKGAFMVWESEIRNQVDELVAQVRIGTYSYNPHRKTL